MDIADETAHGFQALGRGDYAAAAAATHRLILKAPRDPGVLTLVGRLALAAQDADIALSVFEGLVRVPRAPSDTWLDLSQALLLLRRDREAEDAARRAVEADPCCVRAHQRLGEILLSLNDRANAADAFRRAIELDPACVGAYRGLARAADDASRGALARQIDEMLSQPGIRDSDRAELHYAMAELHRRAGGKAFIGAVLAANAAQRSARAGGRKEYQEMFDRLEAAFTPFAFSRAEKADLTEPTPIFILGMPRSGTTLVEQIVTAHPAVAMGGELNYLRGPLTTALQNETGRPFPHGFADLTKAQQNKLAKKFSRRLAFVADDAPFVTDKTPGNFHALGLLRILFPNCRIIRLRREPMDVCLSILAHPFDDQSPHTYDMDLLAYSYARHERLMGRWEELCGDSFLTVEYEKLVENPEAEGRRLLEYCGLEWSPDYLNFQGKRDAVRTFSSLQVRDPVYKTSVGRWRLYENDLAPLRAALERELGRV